MAIVSPANEALVSAVQEVSRREQSPVPYRVTAVLPHEKGFSVVQADLSRACFGKHANPRDVETEGEPVITSMSDVGSVLAGRSDQLIFFCRRKGDRTANFYEWVLVDERLMPRMIRGETVVVGFAEVA